MSAYSHLAGFYMDSNSTYPAGGQWPSHWTPIPVHTVEIGTDHVSILTNCWSLKFPKFQLLSTDAHCPRMTQIHEDRKHAASFQSFMMSQKVRTLENKLQAIIIFSHFFNKFHKRRALTLITLKVTPIYLHFMLQLQLRFLN